MIVKVCGMRQAENIRRVEALGIDWMGFIFWPRSSRYVNAVPDYLPQRARRVGVFVDAEIKDIVRHVHDFGLNAIQLHGHESADYMKRLREKCGGVDIIKAVSVAGRDDIAPFMTSGGVADYLLFDTKCPTVGGSGQQFDWTVLEAYDGTAPFLLSGGIGPGDAALVKAFRHPRCIGIDLNSRFELAPGLKDADALAAFLQELQNP